MSSFHQSHSDPNASSGGGALRSNALEGQVLGGDFEIRRKIGQGGMGTVYEAWQRSLKRPVALKVLANSLVMSGNVVTRFQREAQAAANLHHANIVPIYAQGEHEGLYYYAMELVEGRSLHEIIAAERGGDGGSSLDLTETRLIVPGGDGAVTDSDGFDSDGTVEMAALNEGGSSEGTSDGGALSASTLSGSTSARYLEIAELVASAADAVDYAHKHGVIHRDIKPHNFMYGNDNRLYITDFGLARVLEQPGVTMTGEFVGSPLYMSPEQITGGLVQIDHRSDIYSLGATLYEWLTLWPPFPGETREQVISKIISSDPPPPRSLNSKTPVDLETICLKALEKSPSRRYSTAAEMAADLRRFAARESIHARRLGPLARLSKFCSRNRAATVAAGISIAVLSLTWAYQSSVKRANERELNQAVAAKKELNEENESLRAQNRRLVQELGDFPLERAVVEPTLKALGDAASGAFSALTESGASSVRSPAPAPRPEDTAELVALAQQDAKLIKHVVEELITRLRTSPSRPTAMGQSERTAGGMAEEYYRDALDEPTPESALSLVNAAVNTAFDHFEALHLRSLLYLKTSDLEKALADAELLVMFRKDSPAGYFMRGLVGFLRGGSDTLFRDLDEAVRLDPEFAAAWVVRGAVRARRGQFLKALNDFDQALELSPNDTAALEEREQVFRLALYSVRELTELLDREPDNYGALVRRGELHHLRGNYSAAMADYERASEVAGETSAGLIYRKWQTQQKLNELNTRSSRSGSPTSSIQRSGAAFGPVRRWMQAATIRCLSAAVR